MVASGGVWSAASAAFAIQANDGYRSGETDVKGARLLPWKPGALDIHHIATGRGDAALVIGPSGQSLLIDAGASASPPAHSIPPHPNASRQPGEWIARYARRQLEAVNRSAIDVALVTHLHPDHLGDVEATSRSSKDAVYKLAGISEVDAYIPIRRLIDRGYPGYDWPTTSSAPFATNYVQYVRARIHAGRTVERLRVGAVDQLDTQDSDEAFEIRAIAGNGDVWSGSGDQALPLVPPTASLATVDLPDENVLSAALRIRSGAFTYFAGGDLTANTFDGALPWRDVGTAAARVCGPVDVAVAPHHGMFDGLSGDMVRVLSPRAWIIQAWHASHPNLSALERMLSERLYSGPRDIFATGLTSAGELVNKRLTDRFAAKKGHIIVRVAPGGKSFQVVVTDNADENDRVVSVAGPFLSRGKVP